MKNIATGAIALLLVCTAAASELSLDSIEHASLRNDLDALVTLRDDANASADPYAAAYLEFRIGVAANVQGDSKLARSSLKSSARILETVLAASPDSVDSLALLANVYGMAIGVSPMKGPFLGRKAQKLVDRALDIDPNDAHAHLVRGIALYNTPSMFGGSKSGALTSLDRAIAAFETGGQSPAWGAAEARVWRALTLDALERRAEAIAELSTVLSLEPDYAWAYYLLERLDAAG